MDKATQSKPGLKLLVSCLLILLISSMVFDSAIVLAYVNIAAIVGTILAAVKGFEASSTDVPLMAELFEQPVRSLMRDYRMMTDPAAAYFRIDSTG